MRQRERRERHSERKMRQRERDGERPRADLSLLSGSFVPVEPYQLSPFINTKTFHIVSVGHRCQPWNQFIIKASQAFRYRHLETKQ